MINVITDFISIASVRIIAYVYDDAGVLVDPTSIFINIYNPSRELVVEKEAMTNYEEEGEPVKGVYEYYYHKGEEADPMASGRWRGEVLVIDGSGKDAIMSPGNFSFKVH